MSGTLVRRVADHMHAIRYEHAPREVRERVRTALLYNFTMGLAGRAAGGAADAAILRHRTEAGTCTVLGSGETRSARDAAFANAALITARGQNDTYPATVGHVGCVVLPAVLAAAEISRCPGTQFLGAVLRGYEVAARLGAGPAAEANRRGFRTTSVFSVFGAAAGAAAALGLSAEQTANAMAIAANASGGLLQCWADGSDEWRLHVADASERGLLAAFYARDGVRGAARILEGDNGFFRAFGGAVPELALDGWSIRELTFKPYPGCAFNQAPCHVLRGILERDRPPLGQVRSIVVDMNPVDAGYPGVNSYGPFDSETGAIMSGPFMLAATLRDGAPMLRHFREQAGDPELNALARLVVIRPSEAMPRWRCRVNVEVGEDQRLEGATSEGDPFCFGWSEAVPILSPILGEPGDEAASGRFTALAGAIEGLEGAADTSRLVAALARPVVA